MRRIRTTTRNISRVRMLRSELTIESITRSPTEFGLVETDEAEDTFATCLHCPDSPCVSLSEIEINPEIKLETTHYPSEDICTYAAISIRKQQTAPVIDESLCVGCGACIGRCPVAAIRLNSLGVAEVNDEPVGLFAEIDGYDDETFQHQVEQYRCLTRSVVSSADIKHVLNNFSNVLVGLETVQTDSKLAFGLLVRNLLLAIGMQAKAGVPGDTNSRADLVFSFSGKTGLAEIESGDEMLDAVRRLLANYAVARHRYLIPSEELSAFIVCAVFPNKRSDVYEVIGNIQSRIGLTIRVLPLALLSMLATCGYSSDTVDFESGFELSRTKQQVGDESFELLGVDTIESSNYFGALK